jgi:coenzyme F420-0:L-glutamate ligase/coenzyme F420-1:gamma-L-glutamate ligase
MSGIEDRPGRPATQFTALAVENLPEIRPGADLATLLATSFQFQRGDIVVIAQKVVSKAEGRLVDLSSVRPGPESLRLAGISEKDPRVVQLVLDESREVLRVRPGVIIVEDRRGWVCANAGIDRSNIVQSEGGETVCLLPLDPDASAAAIRATLQEACGFKVAVVISDSHGRAWREGTVGVAIGAAGLEALSDRRGRPDRTGYALQHTLVGSADELASAASTLMGQGNEGIPAVVLRGLGLAGSGRAVDLQRPRERDLFR